MTGAAWAEGMYDPVDVVLALREKGLLDDSTSDGRFARRCAEAHNFVLTDPAVTHFAWQVCLRRADLLAELDVPVGLVYGEEAPAGWTVADVQQALGVQARAARAREEREAGPDDPLLPDPIPEGRRRDVDVIAAYPDGRLCLASPFRAKDRSKLIRGRTYDQARRAWSCPIEEWQQIQDLAAEFRIRISPHAQAAIDAARHAGIGDDPDKQYHLFVNPERTHVIYRAGYVQDITDAFKDLKDRTFKKVGKQKVPEWWVPAKDADLVELIAKRFQLRVHPAVESLFEQWVREAEEMRRLSHALDLDDGVEFDIPNVARPLFGYQKAAAFYAQRAGFRTFIADEPGVGKTAAALAACELYDQWPIIVVCPSKAEIGWTREIAAVFPHRTSMRLRGQKARVPEAADFYVVGWPNLSFWVESLLMLRPAGFIVDESQYAKDPKSLRTKAAKAIAGVGTQALPRAKLLELPGAPVPIDGLHLNLTGSYMLNDAKETVAQIKLIHRETDLGGPAALRRYTGAKTTPADLAEFHELLRSKCYIRRAKRDVLTDLPEKLRTWLWVDPDPKVMGEYREAEANLAEYLRRKAYELAAKLGLDADSAEVMAAMRAGGASHLVLIGVLRQLAAKAKLAAASEWAQEFLAGSDEQLLIYAHHRDIVDALTGAVHGTKIQGGMTSEQAQTVMDRFQAGDDRACVLSITAAGVAITLTAASTGLFIEQAWNPATLTQAEDRMHRYGQTNTVTCFYMCAADTIDEDILRLIESKREMVDAATDGGDVDNWDPALGDDPAQVIAAKGSIAGDLIELLTRRALAGPRVREPDMALL